MESELKWTKDKLLFEGKFDSGHSIKLEGGTDENENRGPKPMELVLLAHGGCTGMDVISILKKMRQDVNDFEVKLSGTQSDEHPRVFTSINIEYVIYGKNLDESKVKRAIELSQDKYCPVSGMLKDKVDITHSFKIVDR